MGAPSELQPASEGDHKDVRRELEIQATPQEVWEALATEEGRERWLEDDLDRQIQVELAEEPERLVWWWSRGDEPPTRVEFLVVAAPAGARVIVTERAPEFPLAMFASSFAFVLA